MDRVVWEIGLGWNVLWAWFSVMFGLVFRIKCINLKILGTNVVNSEFTRTKIAIPHKYFPRAFLDHYEFSEGFSCHFF